MGRIRLNYSGFRGLRKAMDDELLRRGENVANAAGSGFKAETAPSKNRARVVVYPDTPEAIRANKDGLVLVKAMGAARK